MASLSFTYPLFLNLAGQLVTLVGVGRVGQRKLAGLLHCGARVRLIDPRLDPEVCHATGVEPIGREYRFGDLAGSRLAFACTDRDEVNQQVLSEARDLGVLCCCCQSPERGDFTLPAVLARGPLRIAVSTGGSSPAMAALLRDQLASQVPDSWGWAIEIISAVRRKWLTEKSETQYNQQVLRHFWQEQLVPALEEGDVARVDRLLAETFGDRYRLANLNIELPEGIS